MLRAGCDVTAPNNLHAHSHSPFLPGPVPTPPVLRPPHRPHTPKAPELLVQAHAFTRAPKLTHHDFSRANTRTDVPEIRPGMAELRFVQKHFAQCARLINCVR